MRGTELYSLLGMSVGYTPGAKSPELASDVMDKGIVITGGGELLRGIDKLLSKVTGVPCQVVEEPLLAVAKGTGIAVENLDAYKKSILWAK